MEEKQEFEILENKTGALEKSSISQAIEKLTPEEMVKIAEREVAALKKIKIISIKLTNENDWIDQKGTPELMNSGARAIATVWGVDISGIKVTKDWLEDSNGRYYAYTAQGTVYSKKLNLYLEEIGTCSQRDSLFGTLNGENKDTAEIDEMDVKKKSVTNLNVRGVTAIIGLRNVTWDMLKEAGLDISKIKKVEYKEGAQKVKRTLSEKNLETRKKIHDLALQLAGGNEEEVKTFIKSASYFKVKDDKGNEQERFAETIEGLTTEKWINVTYSNMMKAFKKAYPDEQLPFEKEGGENHA